MRIGAGRRTAILDRLTPQQHSQPGNTSDLLVFEIGTHRFGLDLQSVREIVRAVMVAPLPGAPPVVEGMIDVRGQIVPVYDFRARFGLPPRALRASDRFVLALAKRRLVAVHCDRVEWLMSVPHDAIDRAGAVTLGDRRIAGAARLPDGIILLTDLAVFLDEAESEALDTALESAVGTAPGAALDAPGTSGNGAHPAPEPSG